MPSPFTNRWDPRTDYSAIDNDDDCAWIGEDREGIWSCVHPMTALASEPELWPAWIEWQSGLRDMTREDFDTKSNFDFEAKLTLACAHAREEQRRMKRPPEECEQS